MRMRLPGSRKSPSRKPRSEESPLNPTGYPELDALLPRLAAIPTLDAAELEAERIAVLGRKQGLLTHTLRALPTLPPDQRKRFGAEANRLKAAFETAFAERDRQVARGSAGTGAVVDPDHARAGTAGSGHATRSPGLSRNASRSSGSSGSPSRSGRKWRPNGSISGRSTSRPTIPRWTCTTPCTWQTGRRADGQTVSHPVRRSVGPSARLSRAVSCSAPTPLRCRSG